MGKGIKIKNTAARVEFGQSNNNNKDFVDPAD